MSNKHKSPNRLREIAAGLVAVALGAGAVGSATYLPTLAKAAQEKVIKTAAPAVAPPDGGSPFASTNSGFEPRGSQAGSEPGN